MKIKNWIRKRSCKQSHKRDGIVVRGISTFPFSSDSAYNSSLTFLLWSSENQIVGVGSRSRGINQSQCTFPCFVIGFVLLLLLPTPTIWFSLDHKRNVSDWVISGIRTLSSTLLIMTLTPSLVKTSLKGLFAWRDWEEGPSTRKILECESFSGHMFSVFSLHLSLVLGSS